VTSTAPIRDDRVLPYTRGLSLCIVPFLVAGFVILYLFPEHTQRLWAWPIRPTMTAMMLASAYLGGAYFFLRVQRMSRWHVIAPGFPSVALFAGLLGVATLIHWDLFTRDNPAFWVWTALYLAAPFLVVGGWLANRRYAAPVAATDELVGRTTRVVIAGLGLTALAAGLAMFVDPSAFIDLWPWVLTPLSARVVAAIWCLGGTGVAVWRDPRWTTVRLMLEVEVVMLTLMLVAAARAHGELDTGKPLAWPLLLGSLAIVAGSVWLWSRHELRPRGVTPGQAVA
jgi:hypothetical protein